MMKQQSPFKDQTQQFVQQLKSGTNGILIAIRIRPLNQRQLQISDFQTLKEMDGQILAVLDPGNQFSVNETLRKNRNKETQFAFDCVFGQKIETKVIYDDLVAVLLDGVMDGYNGTVLAYGPTGCGKTYTMIGTADNPGIMPLSMLDLLSRTHQEKKWKQFLIKVSYIQIYNQTIKDLLISEDRNFDLREDPKEGVIIPGITEVTISGISQLNTVLKVGSRNRSKQSTGANEASSRSHAILQVVVQSKDRAQSTIQETYISKLSLVDLAGSQRAASSNNRGQRMVQGAKINQSLLVLGNCIQALCQSSEKSSISTKNTFIPYRGSKLTRLLKDSLGGNCRTIMIANVSPFVQSFQDTCNTLVYANRAKNIKNSITRNVLNVQTHLTNYVNVINQLKKQNDELKKERREVEIGKTTKQSLPTLHSPVGYASELERIQKMISEHFGKQLEIVQQIYQQAEQIQKAAFEICKLSTRKNDNKNSTEQHVKQTIIEQCTAKKEQLSQKLEQLNDRREGLIKQIKSSELIGQSGQPYLLAVYKEKKVEVQKKETNHKEKLVQLQRKQKQLLIDFMKQQIKIRQRIIQDQKILIQKNNIINRITYSKLSKIEQINSLQLNNNNTFQHKSVGLKKDQPTKNDNLIAKNSIDADPQTLRKKSNKINWIEEDNFDGFESMEKHRLNHYPSQKVSIDKSMVYKAKKPYYNRKKVLADASMDSQNSDKILKMKKVGIDQKIKVKLSNETERKLVSQLNHGKVRSPSPKVRSPQIQRKQMLLNEEEVSKLKLQKQKKIGIIKSNKSRTALDVVMVHR